MVLTGRGTAESRARFSDEVEWKRREIESEWKAG